MFAAAGGHGCPASPTAVTVQDDRVLGGLDEDGADTLALSTPDRRGPRWTRGHRHGGHDTGVSPERRPASSTVRRGMTPKGSNGCQVCVKHEWRRAPANLASRHGRPSGCGRRKRCRPTAIEIGHRPMAWTEGSPGCRDWTTPRVRARLPRRHRRPPSPVGGRPIAART